ncbi:MAG: hypothetical protein AABZ67_01355 [Pseudomonadota bacterium]
MLALLCGSAAAAAPVVYVTGLNSTYTVNSTCAPTDFSCTTAQAVGYAGRSAFVSELRLKGLQVVTSAPAQGTFFRISSTLRNLEVQARPDRDGYFGGICEVTGLVVGGRIPPRLSELDLRHRFRLSAVNFGPEHRLSAAGMENAIAMCLRRQAHWIAEIIRKYP